MEIEIKDITNNPNNIVPLVYFIPKNFNEEPLLSNCKYTALSNLTKIKYYPSYVELISHRTPIVKKIECEKLVILSENPNDIVVNEDCICF